ncbi:18220_t:CDS:2, partial [Gigaspora rosea]
HGAQFSWSDSVFIYGGTGNYCSQPILDTWVVYNMSSQTWEITFNDIKHTKILSDNLTLPKVNGLDINNDVQQSTSAATSAGAANGHHSNILTIILSSIIAILLIVFTVIIIYMKRIINQFKEYDIYPMVEPSEISATR